MIPPSLETLAATLGLSVPVLGWIARKIIARIDQVLAQFELMVKQVGTVTADVKSLDEKIDAVNARVKKLEPIAAQVMIEFQPNGGTSLRDRINAIDRRVTILDGRHHARFEGDGAATYECGPDGQCIYASAALAELFGMSPESFLGTGWLNAIQGAAERQRVWSTWQAAVRSGIPYEDTYVVVAHGRRRRVRAYTRAVKDALGAVLCYFGMVTDLGVETGDPKGD